MPIMSFFICLPMILDVASKCDVRGLKISAAHQGDVHGMETVATP